MATGIAQLPALAPARHYFVDEAGDLSLFDKKGRILLGKPGVSKFFMVGVALLPDPALAHTKLEALRAELLADPYFRGVPSMRPEARKTAIAFHAKDDQPEVRRDVFRLLPELGTKVQVAIRRKAVLAQEAQALFRYGRRKLRPNDVYDDLVERLFRGRPHLRGVDHIFFARRGQAFRKHALEKAIARASNVGASQLEKPTDMLTRTHTGFPSEYAGLQVVDYHLWALQRLYEMGEDRFYLLLAQDFQLIVDVDDTRQNPEGAWYSDVHPLSLEKTDGPRTG
ncbi:MAG: hypothetical protein HY784_13895 [Chloroflexi bacterium]|nr:hypothetical protein [Chloroflexota bacterium]